MPAQAAKLANGQIGMSGERSQRRGNNDSHRLLHGRADVIAPTVGNEIDLATTGGAR